MYDVIDKNFKINAYSVVEWPNQLFGGHKFYVNGSMISVYTVMGTVC